MIDRTVIWQNAKLHINLSLVFRDIILIQHSLNIETEYFFPFFCLISLLTTSLCIGFWFDIIVLV